MSGVIGCLSTAQRAVSIMSGVKSGSAAKNSLHSPTSAPKGMFFGNGKVEDFTPADITFFGSGAAGHLGAQLGEMLVYDRELTAPELHGPHVIGERLRRVFAAIAGLAEVSPSLYFRGESGSGKELAARELHRRARPHGPFVAVNCAAIPESLAEALLFGVRRGADVPPVVRVSEDGVTWYAFPCAATPDDDAEGCAGVTPTEASDPALAIDPARAGGDAFDLAQLGLARARYVRLVDRTRAYYGHDTWCEGAAAGFDLDAVAVVPR